MNERFNRTSICSIVFLDIVGYSQKNDAAQIAIKDRFNALISAALQDVPKSDCIILDTGDGAGIALLGAPEEALFVSLTIRDGILKDNEQHADPLLVRIGINLGSVRVVKDINDRPNIIGDGINVAQRVMSFAEPNQILVSRSYYEIVSRLSNEMSGLFSYSGVKADKHVREHEVYAVGQASGDGSAKPALPHGNGNRVQAGGSANTHAPNNKKTIIAVAGTVLLLLLVAGGYMALRKNEPQVTSGMPTATAPAPQLTAPSRPPSGDNYPTATATAPQPVVSPAPPSELGNKHPIAIAPATQTIAPAIETRPPIAHARQGSALENSTSAAMPAHPKQAKQSEEIPAEPVEEAPPEYTGPGYLTKDASGQQVILYGDAAVAARARDKAKRNSN